MSSDAYRWRSGGCHCGGVRFEVANAHGLSHLSKEPA